MTRFLPSDFIVCFSFSKKKIMTKMEEDLKRVRRNVQVRLLATIV
jgi:hypothetical protein